MGVSCRNYSWGSEGQYPKNLSAAAAPIFHECSLVRKTPSTNVPRKVCFFLPSPGFSANVPANRFNDTLEYGGDEPPGGKKLTAEQEAKKYYFSGVHDHRAGYTGVFDIGDW